MERDIVSRSSENSFAFSANDRRRFSLILTLAHPAKGEGEELPSDFSVDGL
jgi:hypothetical protein